MTGGFHDGSSTCTMVWPFGDAVAVAVVALVGLLLLLALLGRVRLQ